MAGSEDISFWTFANVLTLSRIPFGIAFWFVTDRPIWAVAVLIVGGATDLVDGAVARRSGQAGRNGVGAWLDPVCDKFFVLSMVAALLTVRRPETWMVVAIVAREIVVVPLALVYRLVPGVRRRPMLESFAECPGAHSGFALAPNGQTRWPTRRPRCCQRWGAWRAGCARCCHCPQ